MGTGRIEAFSDGVIAVIITIMVLDLHVPTDAHWRGVLQVAPSVAIYALSFVTVGIFWVNHHHVMHNARSADPPLLWSNLGLVFAMSLIPFVTAFLASAHDAPLPVALYALAMVLASASFTLLAWVIALQQNDVRQRRFFWRYNLKGVAVIALYLLSVPLAYASVDVAYAIFVAIPLLYAWPSRSFVRAE